MFSKPYNTQLTNLKASISPYSDYCEGYGNSCSSGNGYILGVFMGVGKVNKGLGHEGSTMLDEINAFDTAETDGAYLGQINMSIVSSFCGPQGLIWGMDLANNLQNKQQVTTINSTPVYSIEPLVLATQSLFGTVSHRRFPLKPGAHVPCAGKNIKKEGVGQIYAGIAIGIPENRESAACLIMEDVGTLPMFNTSTEKQSYKSVVLTKLAESILQIGKNQLVNYKEIYVGIRSITVGDDEIGCALVACPYFTIAKNACYVFGSRDKDMSHLLSCTLQEWETTLV